MGATICPYLNQDTKQRRHTQMHAADVKLFEEELIITSERLQVILEIPPTSISFLRKSSPLQLIEL